MGTMSVMVWHLWDTHDGYRCVDEFKMILVSHIACFAILIPYMSSTTFRNITKPYYYFEGTLLIFGFAMNAISLWWPIDLTTSFRKPKGSRMRTIPRVPVSGCMPLNSKTSATTMPQGSVIPGEQLSGRSSLASVLDSPAGLIAFKQFCTSEFSIEYVICYVDVLALIVEHGPPLSDSDKFDRAYDVLLRSSIHANAPNKVSISPLLVNELEYFEEISSALDDTPLRYGNDPPECVDAVAKDQTYRSKYDALLNLRDAVIQIMVTDTFPRFKRSTLFHDVISQQMPEQQCREPV